MKKDLTFKQSVTGWKKLSLLNRLCCDHPGLTGKGKAMGEEKKKGGGGAGLATCQKHKSGTEGGRLVSS